MNAPIAAAPLPTSRSPWLDVQITMAFVLPAIGALTILVLAWTYGITSFELVLLVIMYTITATGSEVGFHRHFAHRAFQTHRIITRLLAIAGTMAGQGHVIFWAATHRMHHKHADHPGDPHSPHYVGERATGGFRGWVSSYIGWAFRYELEPQWRALAPDLYRDAAVMSVVRYELVWVAIGLFAPAIAGALWHRSLWGFLMGLLWGGLLRLFLFQQAMLFANSLCHIVGRRPYETPDHSANTFGLAIPTFGGALHNNHHAFPASPRTGLVWWEVDLAGWIISALAFVGLAWDLQTPRAEAIAQKRRPA